MAFSHYQSLSTNQSLQLCIAHKLAEVHCVPSSRSLMKTLNSSVPSIDPCSWLPPAGLCATGDNPLLLNYVQNSCEIWISPNTCFRTSRTLICMLSSPGKLLVGQALSWAIVLQLNAYMKKTHGTYSMLCVPWFTDWFIRAVWQALLSNSYYILLGWL